MNTGNTDRIIRGIAGIILLVAGIVGTGGTLAWVLGIVGVILGGTAITGFCPIYRLFGISTEKQE